MPRTEVYSTIGYVYCEGEIENGFEAAVFRGNESNQQVNRGIGDLAFLGNEQQKGILDCGNREIVGNVLWLLRVGIRDDGLWGRMF